MGEDNRSTFEYTSANVPAGSLGVHQFVPLIDPIGAEYQKWVDTIASGPGSVYASTKRVSNLRVYRFVHNLL